MGWVLAKNKDDELILRNQATYCGYSFTRIPLDDVQMKKVIAFSYCWVARVYNDAIEYHLYRENDEDKFDKLIQRMDSVAKENDTNTSDFVGKYITNIPGTSKLVRTKDKEVIYVAKREIHKDGTQRNDNQINAVCISDEEREAFFADSKRLHGYPKFRGGHYEIHASDGAIYEKWANLMNQHFVESKKQARVDNA